MARARKNSFGKIIWSERPVHEKHRKLETEKTPIQGHKGYCLLNIPPRIYRSQRIPEVGGLMWSSKF